MYKCIKLHVPCSNDALLITCTYTDSTCNNDAYLHTVVINSSVFAFVTHITPNIVQLVCIYIFTMAAGHHWDHLG